LIEPTLLDELICHISSLASVYHKPPSLFVENEMPVVKSLKKAASAAPEAASDAAASSQPAPAPSLIASNNLVDDLLGLDLGGGAPAATAPPYSYSAPPPTGGMDILGGGLDSLLDLGIGGQQQLPVNSNPMGAAAPMGGGLLDLIGIFKSIDFNNSSFDCSFTLPLWVK
jgi:hypothetical protein